MNDFEGAGVAEDVQAGFVAGTRRGGTRARGVSRRAMVAGLGAGMLGVLSLGLVGCGGGDGSGADGDGSTGQAAGEGGADSSVTPGEGLAARIGTMVTEDFLPGWVAQNEGLFAEAGVDVQIVTFQSAQELTTAITAGEIDMAMTDPMVAASLTVGGCEVLLEWVTLGATPQEGCFGIAVGPDSDITVVSQLAGRSIGVGSNTLPEYVMDRLLEAAGLGEGDVVKEEVKKIPVRYQMMESGQTDAAALPASMLALGEANGCVTLVDDTAGDNLSQSVMIARAEFAGADEGAQAVEAVRQAWDGAAEAINADPESYRELLVEKASLPEVLAQDYPVSTYPVGARATSQMIQPILDWMSEKGYLSAPLTFDEQAGAYVSE